MSNTNHAPMPNRYLDDLAVGDHWDGHPIHVEQDAAVRFASQYDPQPMHIDPVAAAQGRFGGLIATGWYVAALVMRDYIETNPWGGTQALGIGVDELRWLHPVRPGDVLTAHREIVELKVSRSKPDRGTVRVRTSVSNQDGRAVMTFSTLIQLPTRPAPER